MGGVPTREDDGLPLSKTRNRGKWGPYARGRRIPAGRGLRRRRVGSLPARTTGPRPVSDPGCSSGVPTHEDDGKPKEEPSSSLWGPYARGRRTPAARGLRLRRGGSLPARTTGPRPVSDPGCSSGVPTHEDDGKPKEEPSSSLWGPYARGRRADAGP